MNTVNDKSLKVLFLAAEATPFVKVGGLADVAGALPKALRQLDVDVRLMLPRYGNTGGKDHDLRRVGGPIAVPLGPGKEQVHLLETEVDGLPVYMIWDEQYLSTREKVYGFNDDPRRFTFFSRAVISTLQMMDREMGWKPDVIHAHDWHTAPVVAWLDVYGKRDAFYRDMATLFTIHNLAYQGLCGRLILTFAQMQDLGHLPVEPPGQVNWMAQGIAHADVLSAASPSYSRDILTPENGMGLDALLSERQERLFGILNGIDDAIWNPDTDPALTQSFNAASLRMRAVNKAALQREVGLPNRAETPLLGVVSRLDPLKGLDIMLPALESLLSQQDVQFVLLGTGESAYEERFRSLQQRFMDRVRVFIKFDDRLARRIYGGIDLFLMPSQYEPGGLGHMLALRYGAIPVVRATGVLADTVIDATTQPKRGNGFVFRPYTADALGEALQRALVVYHNSRQWQALQQRAMEFDFSWSNSARAYVDLYHRAKAQH
ncbi:MAG: glycogen synthase [Anaerolineae bacterium]|nr:glycogen synthase [Anaerolineae bacterium]